MNVKKLKKKLLGAAFLGLLGGALLFEGNGGHAFAATTGTTIVSGSISGGDLDLVAPASASFSAVNLNGSVQTANANPGTLSITDATGTGEGYRVTVQATQLTEKAPSGGFATGTTANVLPKGLLTLTSAGGSISANSGTTATAPKFNGTSWIIDNGSATTIVTANKGEGLGKFDVSFPTNGLSLNLNPNTVMVDKTNYPTGATPYQTTITYTIISGP
ncbi:WxL domain-containing protein [Heyndrickxia camelliae]|nr:WxL domain-containing protein [Heyndrickxia camelliae]